MEYVYGYISKLAKRAGITKGYLSMILSGKRRPLFPVAKRLAEETETSPLVWLEGTPEEIAAALKMAEEKAERERRQLEEEDIDRWKI